MISDGKGSSLENAREPLLYLFQFGRGLTNGPFKGFCASIETQGIKSYQDHERDANLWECLAPSRDNERAHGINYPGHGIKEGQGLHPTRHGR